MNSATPSSIKNLEILYAHPTLKFSNYEIIDSSIRIYAKRKRGYSHCPKCSKKSKRIRSFYTRTITDLPLAAYSVHLKLKVRRFACMNSKCLKRIFSETFPELTNSYSRRTSRASSFLQNLLIEVSSMKGAYLSQLIKMPISNRTCLRIVHTMAMPSYERLHCIGIDDWATRKGMKYGTILVDAETAQPVDLIDSRESAEVSDWLARHPEIKFVTRDRSAAYGAAIKKALPHAEQIADRFHLVTNLGHTILEEIRMEYSSLKKYCEGQSREVSMASESESNAAFSSVHSTSPVVKGQALKQEKLALMNQMKQDGYTISEIARITQSNRRTVYKYLNQGIPSSVRSTQINFNKYSNEINHFCQLKINPSAMFENLKQIGLACSQRAFTRWFSLKYPNYPYKRRRSCTEPLKVNLSMAVQPNPIPPLKKLSIFITQPEYGVSKVTGECSTDRILVDKLIQNFPLLSGLREVYTSFRKILKSANPTLLDDWIERAKALGRKKIESFCKGLKKDIQAIKNAITYPWSNGLVEGHVNRLKNKKREMYGKGWVFRSDHASDFGQTMPL